MNTAIKKGNHYSIKYSNKLWIYGLCFEKTDDIRRYSNGNFSGPGQTKYIFKNCIVYNEKKKLCYKVLGQVTLWHNNIMESKIIEHDAETLIYSLSKRIPNNLDVDTVELIASFVDKNMREIEFYSSPTFNAINIYGDKAESEQASSSSKFDVADQADYGGAKKCKIKSRKSKKQRKNKTIKSNKN